MRASLLAMSRIDADKVQYIAKLARLSLDADDAAQMAEDLDRVLEYVATLDELDTSGITPTAHAITLETPLRDDEPVCGMDPELAMSNAPVSEGTAFSVPKVLDGEAG
jgi:aspartyl-tRNA(Asn)/glutamyl-tRNA(Gln) amidotransferase subunit C